jgi:hypothetical protein
LKGKFAVIRNKLNLALLVWPLVLLLGMLVYFSYQRHQIDKKLVEADGLVWETKDQHFTVRITSRENKEKLHIRIAVLTPEKKEIYKKNEVIDRDMFGGGFVRAVQLDQDAENEIVVWHARAKYYLDFSEGRVTEVSFDQAPLQVKHLAENWHTYNVMAGLEMTLMLMFVLCYYMLYLLVKGTIRFFKRNDPIV